MARKNYSFEKRQRELAKKKKKEDKRQQKAALKGEANKDDGIDASTGAENAQRSEP